MDKIKKYLIRGISIIMVAIVLVVSPASDYLDTQGIGETHASSILNPVTLGALMSVASLAYGVYVDTVHQSTLADEFTASVERKGLVDVIPSITELKQGVTEFVITEALLYAIKDFFETEKAINLSSTFHTYIYGTGAVTWNQAESNVYYDSFMSYYDNVKTAEDYAIAFDGTTAKVYYLDGLEEMIAKTGVVTCIYAARKSDTRYFYGAVNYNSSDGLFVERIYNSYGYYRKYTYSGDGWIDDGGDLEYWGGTAYGVPTLTDNSLSLMPVYLTPLTGFHFGYYNTLQELMENSTYREQVAESYGSYDQKNIDRLLNSTVTQTQLTSVNNSMLPEIQNKNNNGEDSNAIAEWIIAGLAAALIQNNIGSDTTTDIPTDTPTDTPTEGVTVGEQAIIDQSVANATGIKGAIQSATQAITDFFTAPLQGIKTVLDNIYTTLTGVVSGVVEGVKTGVKAILTELFVPDTAELEEAVYSMTEKFSFADSLLTLAEDIGNKISGANGPPVIYIDFSESEDERYQSIGKLVAVDFAWYERYKPYGDMILSAVLWCFFILRMLRGAPSIFKGMQSGMEVPDSTYQPFGNYVPPSQRIDMK